MKSLEEWTGFLNFDYDFNFMDAPEAEVKKCSHKWVEVGFMHSKIVCKHCDIEKTKWEQNK